MFTMMPRFQDYHIIILNVSLGLSPCVHVESTQRLSQQMIDMTLNSADEFTVLASLV